VTTTLVCCAAKVCIDIFPIPADTNEMGIFRRVFLQLVKTYGEELFQVVTADPGSCSEANGRLVEQHHRAYLFRLKPGDQPTLYEEAHRLLGRMRPEQAEATTVDQVGKTTVIRRVWRTRVAGMAGITCARCYEWSRNGSRRTATTASSSATTSRACATAACPPACALETPPPWPDPAGLRSTPAPPGRRT